MPPTAPRPPLPTLAVWATLGLALAGCAQDDAGAGGEPAAEPAPPPPPPSSVITNLRDIAFAPELEIDLDAMERRESGLYVQVLETGSGTEAGYGDEMGIHYRLWLPNGHLVDATRDHDPPEPFEIVLGQTDLIEGWVEGVTGMRLGERRRLVVPYDLAYGERGLPTQGIPGYSPLVFEVELASHREAGT